MFVVSVLVTASATAPEIRAARFDALRRCLEHFFKSASGEAGSLLKQGRLDLLSFQNERYEYGFAASVFIWWEARQAIAAVNEFFDGELHKAIV